MLYRQRATFETVFKISKWLFLHHVTQATEYGYFIGSYTRTPYWLYQGYPKCTTHQYLCLRRLSNRV